MREMPPPPKSHEPRFNQDHYDHLVHCAKAKDFSDWNKWRIDTMFEEVLLEGADLENPFDLGNPRILMVIDGETQDLAWSYEMPLTLSSVAGGISGLMLGPDVNQDGKLDITGYIQLPGDWEQIIEWETSCVA